MIIAVLAFGVASAGAASGGFRVGGYAPHESWVVHHTSASVDLQLIDHGRQIAARGTGLSCPNNGKAPFEQYAGITMTVQLPHAIAVSSSGRFAFHGNVKVSTYEDQTPYPVVTEFSLSGQFVHGTIKPLKTIAVRGKVAASACAGTVPATFKLVYDPAA